MWEQILKLESDVRVPANKSLLSRFVSFTIGKVAINLRTLRSFKTKESSHFFYTKETLENHRHWFGRCLAKTKNESISLNQHIDLLGPCDGKIPVRVWSGFL